VYPNPVIDKLFVQSNKGAIQSVALFDVLGRHVFKTPAGNNDEVTIPVESLQAGIYVLQIESGSGNFTTRIHIKH
jgi:hypothetical protein